MMDLRLTGKADRGAPRFFILRCRSWTCLSLPVKGVNGGRAEQHCQQLQQCYIACCGYLLRWLEGAENHPRAVTMMSLHFLLLKQPLLCRRDRFGLLSLSASKAYEKAATPNTSAQARSSQQALCKARAVARPGYSQVNPAFLAAFCSAAARPFAIEGPTGCGAVLLGVQWTA